MLDSRMLDVFKVTFIERDHGDRYVVCNGFSSLSDTLYQDNYYGAWGVKSVKLISDGQGVIVAESV